MATLGPPVEDFETMTATTTTAKKRSSSEAGLRDRGSDHDDAAAEVADADIKKTREKNWENITQMHNKGYRPWVKTGADAKNSFIRTAEVYCIGCKKAVSGLDLGNLKKHEDGSKDAKTSQHKTYWDNHKQSQQIKTLFQLQNQTQQRDLLTAGMVQRRKDIAQHLRGITAAVIVGGGTNPHQIQKIFGRESLIPEALAALTKQSMLFGAETTIRSDLRDIEKELKELIIKKVKFTAGALVIDGATFNHEHGMGVAYISAYLPEPLFLGIIWAEKDEDAEDGWSYDATRCSRDIEDMMGEYSIDIKKQIVCLTGDNVSFNDCVAENLGLERGKCAAHALSLTVKKAVLSLPLFKELVVTSSGIMHAGGTNARARALRELGVDPKTITVYPNRFGSVIEPAAVRLEHFETMKEFHMNTTIFPLNERVPTVTGFNDVEDEQSIVSKAIKCAKAHESPQAKLVLAICGILFQSVPKLIKEASTDSLHLPKEFPDHLKKYRRHLVSCSSLPHSVTYQAKEKAYPTDGIKNKSANVRKMEELVAKLASELNDNVKSAASIALESFDKHIQPMLRFFEKAALYNVNSPVIEKSDLSSITKDVVCCLKKHFGPTIAQEFVDYQDDVMRLMAAEAEKPPTWSAEEWDAHSPTERDKHIAGRWGYLDSSKYWTDKLPLPKDRDPSQPSLAEVALWHLSFPTSSIFVERVFGRMRMMGVPQRLSADNQTFARELLFRSNPTLMTEILKKALSAYDSV